MDLVSGYDSDSDDDKPKPGLSSLLPAPSASTSKSIGLTLPPPSSFEFTLPPAKLGQKRKAEKRQIRIDALGALEGEDDLPPPKRTSNVGASNGKSGLSGLLGMLPAPKQKAPPAHIEVKEKVDAPANNSGLLTGSEGRLELIASVTEPKKVKGNNDFRAMLGLKPSKLTEKTVTSVQRTQPIQAPKAASAVAEGEKEAVAYTPVKKPDFFTFSERSSTIAPSDKITSGISFSTAPAVEDEQDQTHDEDVYEEDQYRGWQQGPDGNWFPVTPEAHTAYNAYLSTQAAAPNRFSDRPADMMYGDINSMQTVDANASRQAWQSRPSTEMNSISSDLDRKYAMAAASIATPDQGIPLVDQEEEVKKMDKKTNFRARRKGQLSALIAQAEENREKLEERWSRGKEGRNAAKEKYGF
jgi:hypothetical protein